MSVSINTMRDIRRVYILPQKDWKRHQNSLMLWIMTKHLACVFLARRNQYTKQAGQAVLFFKLLTNTYTFYRCNKLEQRSYARCKYQHM